MTKYEYDTMLLNRDNTDEFQKELEQRVEAGFEIFYAAMTASNSSIHIAYFLRREITGPITHQSVPMECIETLRGLAYEVHRMMTNAPQNNSYEKALELFFVNAEELLGLK